jgi:hypothetical protein
MSGTSCISQAAAGNEWETNPFGQEFLNFQISVLLFTIILVLESNTTIHLS